MFSGNIPYNTPSINVLSKTPENTEYSQSKEISIEYPSLKIVEEHYYIKSSEKITMSNVVNICGIDTLPNSCISSNVSEIEANTWYELSGNTTFTLTKNLTIETIIGHNNQYGSKGTYTEEKIDATLPTSEITIVATTTDKAVVYEKCEDLESGIIKIEYSKDNGTTYQESNVFESLETNGKYIFKVKCTNGSGMSNESLPTEEMSPKEITKPTIVQHLQEPEGTDYAKRRVLEITYKDTDVENLEHYFKSDVTVGIETGVITHSCGTDVNPGECTSVSDVTTLVANTWYKTSNNYVYISYRTPVYLYAQKKDSTGNKADATTYLVTNIDTIISEVGISVSSIKTDRATITASCSDTSGIIKYEFNNGGNWMDNGTSNVYTFTNLNQTTDYTIKVRCTNGSGLTNESNSTAKTKTIVIPTITQLSQTPSNSEYVQNRVLRIIFDGTNVVNPKYYYSYDNSTWNLVTTSTYDITFTENGKLYAKTVDEKGNVAASDVYEVTNIIVAYQVGDKVILTDGNNATSEWYVIENSDSSKDTVKLLSAKSIDYIYYDGDEETYGSSNYETSNVKTYLDNYRNGLNLSSKINEIRLLNQNELESLGCNFSTEQCKNSPSWLYNPSYYWTMVPSPSGIWIVDTSYLFDETHNTEANVRPVIIVSKEVVTKSN